MEPQAQPETQAPNPEDGSGLEQARATLEETAGLLKTTLGLAATEGRLALSALCSLAVTAVYLAGLWICVFLVAQAALACAIAETGLPWSLAFIGVGAVDLVVISVLALYRLVLRARLGMPATRALLRGD